MATAVEPGLFRNVRRAYRKSCVSALISRRLRIVTLAGEQPEAAAGLQRALKGSQKPQPGVVPSRGSYYLILRVGLSACPRSRCPL